jgi:hypothetical protein
MRHVSPLVYGICVGPRPVYREVTEPAIRRIAPDAHIIALTGRRSIFAGYNEILDRARSLNPAGVVLMHDDLELRDPDTESKLRDALSQPDVAIVGLIGGKGVRDMAWWRADEFVGRAHDTFALREMDTPEGDVDIADGILLAMSPWAVEHLRFDERRYRGFHGYDADICRQALAAGKRVVVANIDTFHYATTIVGQESHEWHRSLYAWRLKWADASLRQRLTWRAKRLAHALFT